MNDCTDCRAEDCGTDRANPTRQDVEDVKNDRQRMRYCLVKQWVAWRKTTLTDAVANVLPRDLLIVPAWTAEAVSHVTSRQIEALSEEEVVELVKKWGGLVRHADRDTAKMLHKKLQHHNLYDLTDEEWKHGLKYGMFGAMLAGVQE